MARDLKALPGRRQAAAELIAEGLARICLPEGGRVRPSLCISILGSGMAFAVSCNLAGLVMLSASLGRALLELAALSIGAICVFAAVRRLAGIVAGAYLSRAMKDAAVAVGDFLLRFAGGTPLAILSGWVVSLAIPRLPGRLIPFAGPVVGAAELVVLLVLASLFGPLRGKTCRGLRADS